MNRNTQSDIEESLRYWTLFVQGNNKAYEWIYNQYIQHLYQYGCRFCEDSETVKDNIQNVFINIYQNKEKLSTPTNVKVYLMAALKYALYNSQNKANLHNTYVANTTLNFDLSVEDRFIEDEAKQVQNQTIAHLLKTLSPRQREIIYYRFYEDLKYDEICRLMNLNYQSAYNLLQRSLIKLRESSSAFPLFLLLYKPTFLNLFHFR